MHIILYCILCLQRIGQSLRQGGPPNLKLERFVEAVKDEEASLSYHALIGTRKQSVSDMEQIFSESSPLFRKQGLFYRS